MREHSTHRAHDNDTIARVFQIKSVTDLEGTFISLHNADLNAGQRLVEAAYAAERDLPFSELEQAVHGTEAFLRKTELENGLYYITIHRCSDGHEIFSDNTFSRKSFRIDGQTGELTKPELFHNIELGSGFQLKLTVPDVHRSTTATIAEKEFLDVADGSCYFLCHYTIRTPPPTDRPTLSKIPSARIAHEQWNYVDTLSGKVRVEEKFDICTHPRSDDLATFSIAVFTAENEVDSVTFRFNYLGKLREISSHSTSFLENALWSNPELLGALDKGSGEVVTFSPNSHEAAVISEKILGKQLSKLVLDVPDTMAGIIAAAKATETIGISDAIKVT